MTFQACGACRQTWPTADEFVADPGVRLIGLQASAARPDLNLLIFEHRCGSSISILVARLRHLLPEVPPGGPVETLFGTSECRGHCRRIEDLESCDAPCANARDRDLARLIVQRAAARSSL